MKIDIPTALKEVESQKEHYKPFKKQKTLPIELEAEIILQEERLKKAQ